MLNLASHCPILTHSSSDLPWTMPAQKPPAKASLYQVSWAFDTAAAMALPGTIGVDNLRALNGEYGNLLDFWLFALVGCDDDCRICTLRNNDDARTFGVLLGRLREQCCQFGYRGRRMALRLCPGLDLVLVCEDIVAVW